MNDIYLKWGVDMVNSIDNIIDGITKEDDFIYEVSTETHGIVKSFDEWRDKVFDIQNSHLYLPAIIDQKGVEYLSNSSGMKGFMTGPVAMFEGKTLAAVTRKVLDISEFRDYIADKSIFLYTVMFYPNFPVYAEVDSSYVISDLDNPYISSEPQHWIVRYSELD